MSKDPREQKIAKLESMYDQLYTEYKHLNALLKRVGFEKGIPSLKEAAEELINRPNPKLQKENDHE